MLSKLHGTVKASFFGSFIENFDSSIKYFHYHLEQSLKTCTEGKTEEKKIDSRCSLGYIKDQL
jgi:hypothetical protein